MWGHCCTRIFYPCDTDTGTDTGTDTVCVGIMDDVRLNLPWDLVDACHGLGLDFGKYTEPDFDYVLLYDGFANIHFKASW